VIEMLEWVGDLPELAGFCRAPVFHVKSCSPFLTASLHRQMMLDCSICRETSMTCLKRCTNPSTAPICCWDYGAPRRRGRRVSGMLPPPPSERRVVYWSEERAHADRTLCEVT